MGWKWFSVKSLYRTEAIGKPIAKDKYYNKTVTLVEERVLMFKARNHKEAIKKAEKESQGYIQDSHVNPYGQRVTTRFMEALDSFELFAKPHKKTKSGLEVYSTTFLISKKISDASVVNMHLGNDDLFPDKFRKNILNRQFSGIVGDLEKHKKIDD
jgi:hypothetical protein